MSQNITPESVDSDSEGSRPPLNHKLIFRFYSPLALSWLFMAIEGPISVSIISRMAAPVVNTAAFNLLMSLALFIEAPIIDLLSTSTTLAESRRAYLSIRKFVLWLMAFETVAHAAFVLSPLYTLVTVGIMKVPEPTAEIARTGLIIMIPWSALIAWRRFHQGILIRFGRTRRVGLGTLIRVITLTTVGFTLYATRAADGVTVAATALICSVFAEAVFSFAAARPVISDVFAPGRNEGQHLSFGKLAGFHFPLTATTIVMFFAMPMTTSALARSPEGQVGMAAWQVSTSILWMTRAAVYALPEVIITLGRSRQAVAALRSFTLICGLGSTLLVAVMWSSGLAEAIFRSVLKADPQTMPLAMLVFACGIPLPTIVALQSFCRGMLTLSHRTPARTAAVVVGFLVLTASLQIGIVQGFSGVVTASVGQWTSMGAELVVLYWFWSRYQKAGS